MDRHTSHSGLTIAICCGTLAAGHKQNRGGRPLAPSFCPFSLVGRLEQLLSSSLLLAATALTEARGRLRCATKLLVTQRAPPPLAHTSQRGDECAHGTITARAQAEES